MAGGPRAGRPGRPAAGSAAPGSGCRRGPPGGATCSASATQSTSGCTSGSRPANAATAAVNPPAGSPRWSSPGRTVTASAGSCSWSVSSGPPLPSPAGQQQHPPPGGGIGGPERPDQGGDLPGAGLGVVHHHQQRPVGVGHPGRVIGGPGQQAGGPGLAIRVRLPGQLVGQPAGQPGLALPARPDDQAQVHQHRVGAPPGQLIEQIGAAVERHHLPVRGQQPRRRGLRPTPRPGPPGRQHRLHQPDQLHGFEVGRAQRPGAVLSQGRGETVVAGEAVHRQGTEPALVALLIDDQHPDQQPVREQAGTAGTLPRRRLAFQLLRNSCPPSGRTGRRSAATAG